MPLDLRSLIYGSSNSNGNSNNNNTGSNKNVASENDRRPKTSTEKQQQEQPKRKRVRIAKDGDETTKRKRKKRPKLHTTDENDSDDDDGSDNGITEEEDEDEAEDVSLQSEAVAAAAPVPVLSTQMNHDEYDEKAVEAAKRLKKTTAHLEQLFGQWSSRSFTNVDASDDSNNSRASNDEDAELDDHVDDDITRRKPPPKTTTAAATTAAPATNTTTTTISTDDNNTEDADKGKKRKPRKRKVMTEEEREIHEGLRRKKLERFREWISVRNRWKGRKVDLRKEQDVGNAIHRTILRLHKENEKQQQQVDEEEEAAAAAVAVRESQRQPPPAAAAAAGNDKNEDDDLNSTDEEQEILLNRLLQGNAQARQAAAAAAGDNSTNDIVPDTIESTLARPYAERGLDYWEMGKTRPPRPQKLAQQRIRYVPTFERIIVKPKGKKRRTTTTTNANEQQQRESDIAVAARKKAAYEAENNRLGFYSFPSTVAMPLEEFHASAWPLSHPSRNGGRAGPEHGWFFHRRLVLRLAARQLVGAPVPNNNSHDATTALAMSATNNRLIGALWNTKLADSHRQSLLLSEAQNAGVRMEAFMTHVWKDRSMAANLLGVSTAASSTARIGGERRGQAAVMAGLPVAFIGTTLRPYTALCGSHIERLVRHESTGQRIDWEPNSKHGVSRKKRGRQHFTAITSYIPTPGTEPPIPCFPLDETQCIFGPTDKNATAQHASFFTDGQVIPTVDDTVYRITLSTLLARWATAIASAPSADTGARTTTTSNNNSFLLDDDYDKGIDENNRKNNSYRFTVQDQIERMVQQTVDLNKNNRFKLLGPLSWREDAEDGLPLVPLYRAMLGYCSLEASGYREQRESGSHDKNRWDDYEEDDSHGGRVDNAHSNKLTLKDIAQETMQFCEKHQDHNGLLSFPKLHMILALLGLSTELPESGVEILAQPLEDEMQHQTPFDIMRNLLEHLEEEEFISNNVAILEFAMYQAAERFGRCVQKDPAQVSYHTWHLGTLAGCLLLCSGNRIGSGARRFPSSLSASSSSSAVTSSQDRLRRSLGGDSNDDIDAPQHEVRRKLPKFHELRIETARAFRLLLQLTKYQQSPRCNLAVASFLQWRQVIALLLGPPSFVDFYYDPFEDIRSLHSRHFNGLMLSGQASLVVLIEFRRRMSTKRSNRDCRLTFMANALERDPGRLEHWRALVRALGPVGVRVDPARRSSCAECQECHRVHKNLNIDHESFNHDRDSSSGGWANNRLDWWDSNLLHVPKKKFGENIETDMFCSIVESKLESMSVAEQSAEVGDEDETDDSAPSLKWLEDIISSDLFDNPNAPSPSTEDREQVYDMDLPASFLESSHDDSDSETDLSREVDDIPLMSPFPFDDGAAEKNEILCYKLAVTCHMYGLFHPHVERILVALFSSCWDGAQQELQTDCTAWTCISWLYSWFGLDVLALIRVALLSPPHVNAAKVDNARYSAAMCKAVREGIQMFGLKWAAIQRHFPDFFEKFQLEKAQECYRYMIKTGLIEPMQIDESDAESMGGGGGYDDDDNGGTVNVEDLAARGMLVVQGRIDMPTNPVGLEREAMRVIQDKLNKDTGQALVSEPRRPPTDRPRDLPPPVVASKRMTRRSQSRSTGATLESISAPKARKSRKPRPMTKTIEDFEREALLHMQLASQKWFSGYKPPEKTHPPAAIQRRSTEPQPPSSASHLPPDPTPQPPEELGLPPVVLGVDENSGHSDEGAAFAEV